MRSAVQDQARSVVRVLDDAGEVVGAGFLIGPDLVATCAHVVATALAADAYADSPPEAPVHVDFPLVRADGTEPTAARVHRWSPIGPDGTGDIAVLRLTGPVPGGARMPPLRRVDELWGHGFRVLGFPEGLADGVWATGGLIAAQARPATIRSSRNANPGPTVDEPRTRRNNASASIATINAGQAISR